MVTSIVLWHGAYSWRDSMVYRRTLVLTAWAQATPSKYLDGVGSSPALIIISYFQVVSICQGGHMGGMDDWYRSKGQAMYVHSCKCRNHGVHTGQKTKPDCILQAQMALLRWAPFFCETSGESKIIVLYKKNLTHVTIC